MQFNALIVEKNEDNGETNASVKEIDSSQLPDGEVLVNVEYSSLNYKDGLCIGPGGGLVKKYPHVPGIDFSGTVEESSESNYSKGDKVILTGWRVGEVVWGGYSQKARVKASQLVPLPQGLTTKSAMCIGTAGFSAMLSIMKLEESGMKKDNGDILVTGASGGVGSVSCAILSNLGYSVTAVSGKKNIENFLKNFGVHNVIPRDDFNHEIVKALESSAWGGCIDTVSGNILGRALLQLKSGCSVAIVGNAAEAKFPASSIPFMLRGINILGIDSAMYPFEGRLKVWDRIEKDFPFDLIDSITEVHSLKDLPNLGKDILDGKITGRKIIDVNS